MSNKKTSIQDLLQKMTLEEKAAQLGSCMIIDIVDKEGFSKKKADKVIAEGLGHLSRTQWMMGDIEPEECGRLANEIQSYLINETRLGIPAVIHEECLTGYQTKRATAYPQSIGIASSWNEDLIRLMASYIREEMRAVGATHGLSPVLDVARDARWGRVEETYGEDPYLISAMGCAYVKGLQGDDLSRGVAATAKHFIGYGVTEGGMNWSPSHINDRELFEVYGRPFEAVIREAGLESIMNSYSEIDGVPCAVNPAILTDLLRGRFGFQGTVVADYGAVKMAGMYHHIASDPGEAGVQAIQAGLDVELPKTEGFGNYLVNAVKQGRLQIGAVDQAVRRLLEQKDRLGLFDNPYGQPERIPELFGRKEAADLAAEMARQSIVLLKNDGTLPLSKAQQNIAVIGPNADSFRNLFGDYTFGGHLEGTFNMLNSFNAGGETSEMANGIKMLVGKLYQLDYMTCSFDQLKKKFENDMLNNIAVKTTGQNPRDFGLTALWEGLQMVRNLEIILDFEGIKKMGEFEDSDSLTRNLYENPKTVLDILKTYSPSVSYSRGCDVLGSDQSGFEEAVSLAEKSDLIIAVMGDRSGLDLQSTTGESRDRVSLDLPGVQPKLLQALLDTGKPVVLVLINGRPVSLGDASEKLSAVVEAWLPGEKGPEAIADILFGEYNPSGKLPVSFPRDAGQVPVFYNHKPSGGRSHWYGNYVEMPATPLYPFGHGLSYTVFEYSKLKISQEKKNPDGEIEISFKLKNTGEVAGTETVQLYLQDLQGEVTRPVKQLSGFARVQLDPGEKKDITFTFPPVLTAFYGRDMDFIVEPGTFSVMIGSSSQDIRLDDTFVLGGERRSVTDKVFFSSCKIS